MIQTIGYYICCSRSAQFVANGLMAALKVVRRSIHFNFSQVACLHGLALQQSEGGSRFARLSIRLGGLVEGNCAM